MDKKIILLVDDDPQILLSFDAILKSKEYITAIFQNFTDASQYIYLHSVDLVISDFNVNNDINGIEFFISYIMQRGINFALHTGTFFPTPNALRSFQERLPGNYKIYYNSDIQLNREKVEIVVEDLKNNKKNQFPFFSKPTPVDTILKYFGL